MARKSAAALSVVPFSSIALDGRLPAPSTLGDREKLLWLQIVSTKPAEWFAADSEALLFGYVCAIGSHEYLTDKIKAGERDNIETNEIKELYILQERQAKLMLQFATKMRLTQQSRYDTQSAHTADKKVSGKRPWDID